MTELTFTIAVTDSDELTVTWTADLGPADNSPHRALELALERTHGVETAFAQRYSIRLRLAGHVRTIQEALDDVGSALHADELRKNLEKYLGPLTIRTEVVPEILRKAHGQPQPPALRDLVFGSPVDPNTFTMRVYDLPSGSPTEGDA